MPALAERLLHWLGKRYVVDYDDAIFHNYDLSGNPVLRRVLGRKIDTVMQQAHYVVAGNEYLAARAMEAGVRGIVIIPTVVDHTRYEVRGTLKTGRLVIGWIGSPSTQQYVVGIRAALTEACQTQGARLMLVGSNLDVIAELPGIDVEVVPWTEDNEAALISQMDVGIMPLPDGPWEKGECGYKLIQYMACGVPVIASPVGVNVDIVTHSQCGLLADTPAEWVGALRRLLGSAEQRHQLVTAGRQAVERTYCLAVQEKVLSGIFYSAINQDKP
ncbi:MAG: glycosyltransferase family 4 protein [Spirochaetales bacterium]|jgi:glycosyltransferase involved in cell wall biosynthesis|nr:glycosyltransferase family 4 protein [Spirochaetales bacterium]